MRAPAARRPRPAPAAPGVAQRVAGSSGWGSSSVQSRPAYGLRDATVGATATRVGAQPPEHPPVVTDGIVALRRLDNLNHGREPLVPHDAPERLRPDRAFADPLVAVEPRPEPTLGVVEVQALEMREPNLLVKPLPNLLQRRGQIVPGRVQMGRVETEPHPSVHAGRERVAQRPQLLERAPER